MKDRIPISVLILTYNEEINIEGCLASVSGSDDILVFDSNSSDSTVKIAKRNGARVLKRRFDNYGSQRQAALENGRFKYPWVLVLDADERVDAELAKELKEIASQKSKASYAGYRIRRKDHFLDKWIPRATLYPTWHLRFFKVKGARYEKRSVHEHPILKGPIGQLKGHLLHYSFNKGMEDWITKHRKYAVLEGAEGSKLASQPIDWSGLVNSDPGRKRRALKAFSYKLPFRGLMRFLYMMFVRLAFLDGWPGIRYSFLISRYEHWIEKAIKSARPVKP